MTESAGRSPLVPLSRIAALVALGDLITKQVAVWWVGALHPNVSSAVQFGVVHNDKGAFGLTAGAYTFQVSLALTLAAIVLIIPVARDLAKVDGRAPAALGLIAGGAIGNLVSLLVTPAGVVDFIAIQRADGAGIVLNVADLAAYAGVAMLMRSAAMVIAAIRRNREAQSRALDAERELVLTRFADLELVRSVAREDAATASGAAHESTSGGAARPSHDREVQLRVIHADGGPQRPGRGLAARLREREAGGRPSSASPYLRPMSHQAESRLLR
ncbi:MAG TPA: signal peptidase II [Gemmatimonadaceae bacterium]|nr:signal peptidase II [Gemmatimonadaceae bacterium]